jgi:hypothetical protein
MLRLHTFPIAATRHFTGRIVNEDLKTRALQCGFQVVYAERRGCRQACMWAARHASHREQRSNGQRLRKLAVSYTLPDASRGRRQIDAVDLDQMWSRNEPVERGHA